MLPKKKERTNNSDIEYSLISTLTGMVTHGNDTQLVDSGASKHMKGFKEYLTTLLVKESSQKVKLGDDYQYPIRSRRGLLQTGVGRTLEDEGCTLCTGIEEEPSLYIWIREERIQSCIRGWPSAHMAKREDYQ